MLLYYMYIGLLYCLPCRISIQHKYVTLLGLDVLYRVCYNLPVPGEKTLLRNIITVGRPASRVPNQGLDCSVCCWTAEKGLA